MPGALLAAAAIALAARARRVAILDRLRREGASPPWTLPPAVRQRILPRLSEAGVEISPEDAVLAWLAAAVVGGAGGWALAGAPGSGLVAVAAVVLPAGAVLGASRRRDERVASALPALLEAVARELRSGGTVALALERLATRPGVAGAEAQRVVGRLALGLGLGEALQAWAREPRRVGSDAVVATAAALALASGYGGRAADALDGLSAGLHDRAAVVAEARSLSAQARLSAVVIGALPLVTLLGSPMLGGGGLDVLLGTGAGRAALVTGLALEALAVVWMRRIVRVAL